MVDRLQAGRSHSSAAFAMPLEELTHHSLRALRPMVVQYLINCLPSKPSAHKAEGFGPAGAVQSHSHPGLLTRTEACGHSVTTLASLQCQARELRWCTCSDCQRARCALTFDGSMV